MFNVLLVIIWIASLKVTAQVCHKLGYFEGKAEVSDIPRGEPPTT